MSRSTQPPDHFVFFCEVKRQPLYQAIISDIPYKIIYTDDVEKLIKHCLTHPPLAAMVDVITGMHIGHSTMNHLFDLEVHWPIMRCNMTPEGSAIVMCLSPQKNEPLIQALKAISNGDSSWHNPSSLRKKVRVNVQCRVRLRKKGGNEWFRGNVMNLSRSGSFVLTYDSPDEGDIVDVEILDIATDPILSHARVVWRRKWDESQLLPGCGLEFIQEGITSVFSQVIDELQSSGKLYSKIKYKKYNNLQQS